MNDLIVDPQIRIWVFLPIVIITFLLGIIKHYVTYLLTSQREPDLDEIRDAQMLARSKLLRENGNYIPKSSYAMRKFFFTNDKNGWLTASRPCVAPNFLTDPTKVTEILKNNAVNVLPMIAIGGWIIWMFSGFLIAKVPFPITFRFKVMLQSDIELASLDASWVSSVSWYFLNVCGLRGIYELILGENNTNTALHQQMTVEMNNAPPDVQTLFKTELEAFEMVEHDWLLKDVKLLTMMK